MKKLLDAHKNALFALGKIKRKNEVCRMAGSKKYYQRTDF